MVATAAPRIFGSPPSNPGLICCTKSSVRFDFRFRDGILLTVQRSSRSVGYGAQRKFAMIETVTAVLGLMSAGIFIAHAFDGFRSRA
jgi:hypothetical protein